MIFAVGNGDHILTYRGTNCWQDTVTWARFTNGIAVSSRILVYQQVTNIVQTFKSRAATLGLHVKVYDQIDSGNEFSRTRSGTAATPSAWTPRGPATTSART